ncbi:MAG: membrane protein insertase YidC [Bacteroidales bacterium]|nr:membrane protein insertase YidC [Bacteroidales bacterium]MBQ3976245.1 membrane protein insertase YidC [Bacteroidales bacterium]MBQ7072478.1 membrane protein insertase YidC [Bacteroidales bacterium]
MDKNSIVGLILIAMVLFGFTYVQKRRYENQMAQSVQETEAAQPVPGSTQDPAAASFTGDSQTEQPQVITYKDSLLTLAASGNELFYTLENESLKLTFTTKGAQPYSAQVKGYTNYDKTDLFLFKEGGNKYDVHVYTGEYIKTSDFNFTLVESSDTRLVFRLPFGNGGYIEQKYELPADSYMVNNTLSFVGLGSVIPGNVSNIDIDFATVVPRMEKGFKNESQYSKLDYYFSGEKKPSELGRGRNGSKRIDSKLSWFAFQQQFFSYIIRAKDEFALGDLSVEFFSQDDPSRNLMTCKAEMRMELQKENPDNIQMGFDMYLGPNHYQTLQSYDQKYEKIIPLGGWLVGWFTRFVIIPMFNFFHRFIGSYGLIILLMTLVIKLVVLPFTYKSFASSAKMAALRPFMDKINAKYPKQEDAMKKQQATMDLYKRAGVSPMGGCLPTLLTFPILWAMFRFFPASIELRQQPFLWAKDLSAYDSIIDFGRRIPLLGDHLSLFALLMAIVMWVYSKYTLSSQPNSDDPSAASMRFMSLWMMPIMMFFICNNLSSALSYYYLLSQLIAMLEIWIIRKFIVKPEEVVAKVKASEGKPVPKSKFQQRLEEAQRMQQQQMRAQQNNKKK